MDIQKIKETMNECVYPVYGGVRGHSDAFYDNDIHRLSEAGLKTYIEVCEYNNWHIDWKHNDLARVDIEYLCVPVCNSQTSIWNIVEAMPKLNELIDKGDFYITSPNGFYHIDVALCTYWMFHGADRGLEPPEIIGFHRNPRHTGERILYVLNRIYRHMEKPMPQDVFTERKNTILELCRSAKRGKCYWEYLAQKALVLFERNFWFLNKRRQMTLEEYEMWTIKGLPFSLTSDKINFFQRFGATPCVPIRMLNIAPLAEMLEEKFRKDSDVDETEIRRFIFSVINLPLTIYSCRTKITK